MQPLSALFRGVRGSKQERSPLLLRSLLVCLGIMDLAALS